MSSEENFDSVVFLETTIQIDRVIGTQDRRNSIRYNIEHRRVCTSGHVLGEFNKTLIRDAVTFRDLLVSSPNFGEAVKRLQRYDRRFPRTVDLLATLGFDGEKQTALERLENFIEWQAHDHFWESVDRIASSDDVQRTMDQRGASFVG